mmetsp:Transcript_24499/g.62249  ORF Transcript_24499/g.62249 Transcript_24499/m.62249 type:complete len:190 (-) Transcript_24499:182-751(-)
MASCKSDVPYNFGAGSTLDALVYGSARPGAVSQRCFNAEDKVSEEEVKQWAEFMRENGVKRVVGLLADDEVATYHKPPVDTLREAGLTAVNIAVDKGGPDAAKAVMAAIHEAVEAEEKVVVHCWGGGGRTGKVLAAWLVQKHGLSPSDAAAEVSGTAMHTGTSRRVDAGQLSALLQAAGISGKSGESSN